MSPIERAARALAAEEYSSKDFAPPWWSEDGEPNGDCIILSDDDKQRYRSRVRAVLLAIREPSEGMVREGWLADIPGGRHGEPTFTEAQIGEADAPVIWQAMIDAALNEAG